MTHSICFENFEFNLSPVLRRNIYRMFTLLLFYFPSARVYAQGDQLQYSDYIALADSLYEAKNYPASAQAYTSAFKANGWKGNANDRYNAACSWSLAGVADSAFYNLERIAEKLNFKNPDQLLEDEDLTSLHSDKRWLKLLDRVKENKRNAEVNLNRPLAAKLDSVFDEDQKYRQMMSEVNSKYGRESAEMKNLISTMILVDSLNQILVLKILDQYGWLGPDIVGDKGASALFLVIQHADLRTQEKYLPMMKEAVKNGAARTADLALLIDRVEMRNGRPQVYGSQVTTENGANVFFKIMDEANVNKRRAEMGLEPLELYAKRFGMTYTLPK